MAAGVVGLPLGAGHPIRTAVHGPLGRDEAASNAMTARITTQCIQVTGGQLTVHSWRLVCMYKLYFPTVKT